MRLYRGLCESDRPERVPNRIALSGTDFTDCPYTALSYAGRRHGVVLVLDVPPGAAEVTEEFSMDSTARRFRFWGKFDAYVVAIIEAKELRAQARRQGVVATSREFKAEILERYIAERLRKPAASARTLSEDGKTGSRRQRPRRSTATVAGDTTVVPWLAAEGALGYSPEHPPDRDYYFQYGWVLPEVLAEHTNRRRHYYFGAQRGTYTTETMFSLWAKPGELTRIACAAGCLGDNRVEAPLAIYRTTGEKLGPEYLLIQHGSYQLVHARDQPLLESGVLTLYRGVQESARFLFFEPSELNEDEQRIWQLYCRVQSYVLSDSVRSFNSIHDRAKRCETGHIRDRSWVTDDIARGYGLDIDGDGFTAALWSATHQSFALERWVAEHKFGPHYVVCQTPVGNVRITTFFAGEHEARIIDPRQVKIIETCGCRVEPFVVQRKTPTTHAEQA